MQKRNLLSLFMLIGCVQYVQSKPSEGSKAAPACDQQACSLPDCRCSIPETPGGLDPSQIPQFVMFTFDDNIPPENVDFIQSLSKYKNANGCNVSLTFYTNHVWADYSILNAVHKWGHEVSIHTIDHADLTYATSEEWTNEILDQRTMLNIYGNIPFDETIGFRAPYLGIGGDTMYQALKDNGFLYDCSWPTQTYTPWWSADGTDPLGALWPYTLDYYSTQEQNVGVRPQESIAGLWVNPMTDLEDNKGYPCAMTDFCQSASNELDVSAEAVFEMLKRNFDYHYYTDRTPFPLYTHHYWFTYDDDIGQSVRRGGTQMFIEYVTSLPHVYLAPVSAVVEWTRRPVPLDQLDSFAPLQCDSSPPVADCSSPSACHYLNTPAGAPDEVWMTICEGPCPPNYPWMGNPYGN